MQTFSKRVHIQEGFSPAFFFTKIYTIQCVRYHVSVIDIEDRGYAFTMELRELEWKIVNAPKVPDWILNAEKQLQEIIFDSMLD